MGEAETSGKKFIIDEFKYFLRRNPLLICSMICRDGMKFLGYRLGIKESAFSNVIKRHVSMNPKFFSIR